MIKRITFLLAVALVSSTVATAEVVTRDITYQVEGVDHRGYLAYDDAVKTKRPGIVVVHEWWGHNAYARERARKLAGLGYVAFALDMYGEGKTADHPADAGKFAQASMKNLDLAEERFRAALDQLRQQPQVDATQLGAIGYCFGGGVVLQMARQGLSLDGVVSFHGSLSTSSPAEKEQVKAKILVCNGAEDPMTTEQDLKAIQLEMASAGVDLTVKNYPGAKHSFTNPGADQAGREFNLPLAYNAEADAQSWQDMQDFFERIWTK